MSDEERREDELVSAYLDGEATPAEIAEVERDDALLARVEQLRSVRDAVAAPVAPMPAELKDQMIGAALAAADAGNPRRRAARIVPFHRRHQTRLAVAAAVILLAAVVSAGLIASRGGDDADMAAEAPAAEMADAGSSAADVAVPGEAESTAMPTTTAYVEMAEEEPMAELDIDTAAMAADKAAMAELEAAAAETVADELDEAAMAELEAAAAEAAAQAAVAEAESAMEAPAEEAADAPTSSADDADRPRDEERSVPDEAAVQVVDLGAFKDLQSLFDTVAVRWSAALEDGAMEDSGTCSAAVQQRALELDLETGQSFIATVGAEDPLLLDAQFTRRADGTAIIIYATPPSCETEIYELDAPGDS